MGSLLDTLVVIYEQTGKGPEYYGESYSLSELATIPAVGDLLIDAGIPQGADKRAASSYSVKQVVSRYHQPQTSDSFGPRIILVVERRQAVDDEFEFVAHR